MAEMIKKIDLFTRAFGDPSVGGYFFDVIDEVPTTTEEKIKLQIYKELRSKIEYPHNWQYERSHIVYQMRNYTNFIHDLDKTIAELEGKQ